MSINLLGEPRVYIENRDITNLLSSKAIGIFAYLIVEKKSTKIQREKIATLFWEDSSNKISKYNLRHTLWAIKKILKEHNVDEEIILCPDKQYCLMSQEADVQCDIDALDNIAEEIQNGQWENAERITHLYKGEFLQGLHFKCSPELDDWIIFHRERLEKIYFLSLRKLSDVFSEIGQYGKSIGCLEKLVFINPLDEDINKQLMKLHYLSGDRVAAMKHYEKFNKLLRTELNISPMEQTTELYENIKNGMEHHRKRNIDEKQYHYLKYSVLTEILEQVLSKYPDVLQTIHVSYKLEIAKLILDITIEESAAMIYYLSSDIEKLRIFRASAEVLKISDGIGNLPRIHLNGNIDDISNEFLEYLKNKFPKIKLEISN